MSIKAMTWVWDHSEAEGSARLVHLALADVANDGFDNELWLGVGSIAKKCRLSENTVRAAIETLVKDGYLVLQERGGGRGKRSRYQLNLPESGGYFNTLQLAETPQSTVLNPSICESDSTYITQENSKTLASSTRDGVWDALLDVCQVDEKSIPKTQRGAINKAVKELKEVGATEAEIHRRAAAYKRQYPQAALTPLALWNQWSNLGAPNVTALRPEVERVDYDYVGKQVLSAEDLERNQARVREMGEKFRAFRR